MRNKVVGAANTVTGDRLLSSIRSAEASATMGRGVPVILNNVAGTNDGFDVVLPSTAGAAKSNALVYGITTDSLPAGQRQDIVSFGYVPYALVSVMTRAASSNSWTSSASVASYAVLTIDTVNNCLAVGAATDATNVNAYAILLDSIASYTASATATTDTRTVITVGVRAFARML